MGKGNQSFTFLTSFVNALDETKHVKLLAQSKNLYGPANTI